MSTSLPPVIPQPFANAGARNVIPNTSADPQRAEYAEGFPPLTMTPIASGGKPPLGQDMNGILYAITSALYAYQGGALQPFSTDIATAIGGYNLGALVAMADGAGYWECIVDDNTENPDTGGAGWRPVYAYGATPVSGLTTGVRTLTVVESARRYLVLTGTLSGNVQVVVPNYLQDWLVINSCTVGAFSVTVKTAAGTGVICPAGGAASPTAVYCDGTNVQRVFVPSALPTDVSPTANTIPLRDNLGFMFSVTPAAGDATTKVATTAFVNRATTLAAAGSTVLSNGVILKWGQTTFNNSPQTITFPVAFPSACYGVQLTPRVVSVSLRDKAPVVGTITAANFTMQDSDGSNGTYWFAVGA